MQEHSMRKKFYNGVSLQLLKGMKKTYNNVAL